MMTENLLDQDPVAFGMTAEGIVAMCDAHLKKATELRDELRSLASAADEALTWDSVMGRFDALAYALTNAVAFAQLMSVAHPDARVRDAAKTAEPKVSAFDTALYLDREVASVVRRYAAKKEALAEDQARLLMYALRDYRRNGLELDDAGQVRLREMNEAMTRLGQDFEQNIAASLDEIRIRPEQLAGLPAEYVATHTAGPDGLVGISTAYPDAFPFLQYADDREAALELYKKFNNRAVEKNLGVLDQLLALRREKAALLGYATWADFVLEPRMAKDAKTVHAFLTDIKSQVVPRALKEKAILVEEQRVLGKKQSDEILPCDVGYLFDKASMTKFAFDSKKLREYFPVAVVEEGIFAVYATLLGLRFSRIESPAWHEDVRVYEVRDAKSDALLGKLYIDLYPRENKYSHAAVFTIRPTRIATDGTRTLPMAALVCNFQKPGETASLLSHREVETFFHEFGHAVHDLVSTARLASFAGTNVARDFVEAPSQLLEEWAWDRATLDLCAKHFKTGERIPDDLFNAFQKTRTFGLAIGTQRQLNLAAYDHALHTLPEVQDTTALLEKITREYTLFPYVPGTHMQASFGHLNGYDAAYYGYQWALSIAHDLFTRFKKEGMQNTETGRAYRAAILEPGGGRDERDMIRTFLGREPSNEAYKEYLLS